MLKIQVIAIGRMKEDWMRQGIAEYQKRLGAYCKFELIELEEYRLPDHPSEAEIAHGLEEEGNRILKKAAGLLFPLCIEGEMLTSPQLAGLVEGNTTASKPVRGWAYLRYSLPLVAPLQKMACTPRRFTRAARSFGSTSLMEASDAPRMEQAWMTSHTASPLPMMMARLASRSSHAGVGLWVRVAISGQNRFCGWP